GCAVGSICQAKPAAPFLAGRLCIYQAGSAPCPATGYTIKAAASFTAVRDTRGCACQCLSTSNCQGSYTLYSDTMCTTGGTTIALSTSAPCGVSTYRSIKLVAAPTSSPGPCSMGTTQAVGSVTGDPTAETTICCTP